MSLEKINAGLKRLGEIGDCTANMAKVQEAHFDNPNFVKLMEQHSQLVDEVTALIQAALPREERRDAKHHQAIGGGV